MRWCGLAFVLLLAVGCGGSEQAPLTEGTEIDLPTHPDWEDGPAALVAGTIEFDEETECVLVGISPGYRTLVVWPPGTRATRDPFRVVLSDGREIREGDYVQGGGGAYGFDTPERCDAVSDGADMFNWDEEIKISSSSRSSSEADGEDTSGEGEAVERLLLEYTDADPNFEADVGEVEFTDCSPAAGVEYEGHPAFYCEAGNDSTVASLCVARVGDELFFSGGRVMCEEDFERAYPTEG
jgi:hypothetical protein